MQTNPKPAKKKRSGKSHKNHKDHSTSENGNRSNKRNDKDRTGSKQHREKKQRTDNNNTTNGNHDQHKSRSKRKRRDSSSSKHGSSGGGGDTKASVLKAALAQMISTAAVECTSGLGDENDRTSSGKTGQFDFYLFAQSWAPRFCCISPQKCAAENIQSSYVSPHGLWPAYFQADSNNRTYPAFCTTSNHNSNHNSGREQHEWEKHGTCTGLNANQYFNEELNLSDKTSNVGDVLSSSSGDSVDVDELLAEYGGEKFVAVKADRFCRLEEITTCWEKLADGRVGNPRECPDHVLASARNSAIMQNNCTRLWLDSPGSCQFINKSMQSYLKTGISKE